MEQVSAFRHITSRIFINAPIDRLRTDLLDLFLRHKFQPEIGLEGGALWTLAREDWSALAQTLASHGLSCTLHAPFHDLAPGGFEPEIIRISRKKLALAFDLLPVFKPRSIVCHLGFEIFKHGANMERWLETSVTTWQPLVARAQDQGVRVMFENTYEATPEAHRLLFNELDPAGTGFCLDTGHLLAFARTSFEPWLDELGPWLGQLHLHDNDGRMDGHLGLGKGIFDFQALFKALDNFQPDPICTIEPHSQDALWQSLSYLARHDLFREKHISSP
jgi:sugar phosphate isomerase/epimerase